MKNDKKYNLILLILINCIMPIKASTLDSLINRTSFFLQNNNKIKKTEHFAQIDCLQKEFKLPIDIKNIPQYKSVYFDNEYYKIYDNYFENKKVLDYQLKQDIIANYKEDNRALIRLCMFCELQDSIENYLSIIQANLNTNREDKLFFGSIQLMSLCKSNCIIDSTIELTLKKLAITKLDYLIHKKDASINDLQIRITAMALLSYLKGYDYISSDDIKKYLENTINIDGGYPLAFFDSSSNINVSIYALWALCEIREHNKTKQNTP